MPPTHDAVEANQQLVMSLYEAARNHDASTFFEGCAAEIVVHEPPSLAVAGVYHGLDQFGGLLAQTAEDYDVSTLTPERIVASGDLVVAMLRMKTQDHTFEARITEWWKIENGKVVEIRPFHWDTDGLNASLSHR